VEHRIARAQDIAPGTAAPFEANGITVLVCNVDGRYFAIEDVCTHDGAPLDQGTLEGRCIVCPRHGATFDVETGAATLPAAAPVACFPVRVENGELILDV
jgi:3-phenylpropionate/trans-cinnamate dioxygenase ferredoxin subunit